MNKLPKTIQLVKAILEKYPETRDDDNLLWAKVLEAVNFDSSDMTLSFVLENVKRYGLPSFQTVSRARRKVQQDHPELKGTARIQQKRKEQEQKYREFFGNGEAHF